MQAFSHDSERRYTTSMKREKKKVANYVNFYQFRFNTIFSNLIRDSRLTQPAITEFATFCDCHSFQRRLFIFNSRITGTSWQIVILLIK